MRLACNSGTGFGVPSVVCAWTLLPVPELPPGDPRALKVSGTMERAAGPLPDSQGTAFRAGVAGFTASRMSGIRTVVS